MLTVIPTAIDINCIDWRIEHASSSAEWWGR
jgi:hypothetical protein